MTSRLLAILNFALALFLYPVALALLIWIGWSGRSVFWAFGVVAVVLYLDRTWWQIGRYWWQRLRQTRKR